MPITVKEGMQWVRSIRAKEKVRETHTGFDTHRPVILEAKNIDFQYEVNMPRVLDRLSVSLEKGEKLAVVGGNGSGKSTLLKVLAGLMRPQRGKVYFNGKKITGQLRDEIAYLPQNPRLYFSEESVKLEMEKAAAESHASAEITKKMMEQMHLSGLKNRHPYDLSGGEMQKLAMACLLLRQPAVLLIDEPTKGLDPESKKRFGQWLNAYSQQGISIMFVTHDIEFAARFADRVAMMFHGEITAASDTESFFKGNAFYTTAIDRMTRKAAVPEVLTVEEAERKWVVPNGLY
ncbi:MAG: energy-coupling factor ABC transporter ATP-binding protein [Tuberibacillus sp.]